jgi:cytoskeleton protein RodZ
MDANVTADARPSPGTAGAKLRAAREAAGLSVDAVAQQLKLAPRQVKALEDDAWERLPGRTFVRGFARNYARFVQLDPEVVLALLPAADTSPALERPALAATRRPMGEMPIERVAKPSAARWLVPLLLVVIVAAVAYYELGRSPLRLPFGLGGSTPVDEAKPAAPTSAPATSGSAGTQTTTLPNPVVAASAPASNATNAAAATTSAIPSAAPAPAPATPEITASPTAASPPASAAPADHAQGGASAAEVPLVLTFRGTSWAEVKDARGRVVLQMTGGAGMTQTVTAVAPLELALGNAPDVDVTFRGQTLDLAPYTRGSVARVALK